LAPIAIEKQVRLETGNATLEDLVEEAKLYSSPEEFRARYGRIYDPDMVGTASSIRDQIFAALNAQKGAK